MLMPCLNGHVLTQTVDIVVQKEQQYIENEILGKKIGINVTGIKSEDFDVSHTHNVEVVLIINTFWVYYIMEIYIPLTALRKEQHWDPDLERMIQFKEAEIDQCDQNL